MNFCAQISDADAPEIFLAASGMRPHIDDLSPLPTDAKSSRFFSFAPLSANSKVRRDGGGTDVRFHGTSSQGHLTSVLVRGFTPYLYVSLDPLVQLGDEALEQLGGLDGAVRELIRELQAMLLCISAHSEQNSTERSVMCETATCRKVVAAYGDQEAFVGKSRRAFAAGGGGGDGTSATQDDSADSKTVLPIVRWSISDGRPLRGTGPMAGYRGMHATKFLRIDFYAPSFVAKCRDLLQGVHADLGFIERAKRIATTNLFVERQRAKAAQIAAEKQKAEASKRMAPGAGIDRFTQRRRRDEGEDEPMPDMAPLIDADGEDEQNGRDKHGGGAKRDDDAGDGPGALEGVPMVSASDAMDVDQRPSDNHAREEAKKRCKDPLYERLVHELDDEFRRIACAPLVEYEQGLAEGARYLLSDVRYEVYEADIDFVLRVAIDCGFSYEHWVRVDCADPRTRRLEAGERETKCQIELECHYQCLSYDEKDPLQNTLPRHLLASLDCEMRPPPSGKFPDAESDPMLQCVWILNAQQPDASTGAWYRSVSFVLLDTATKGVPMRAGCGERAVLCFKSEAVLFAAMARFVRLLQPQIVSGFNTDGFDLPYIVKRADALGVGAAMRTCWPMTHRSAPISIRPATFESSAASRIDFNDVHAEGVLFLDMLTYFRKSGMRFRTYSLNGIAAQLLGEQKEDVAYHLIGPMQDAGPVEREQLRSYCEKDALLPLLLFRKQKLWPSLVEMARINVCSIDYLLKRGQQIRSKCCIYKAAAQVKPLPLRVYTRTDAERAATAGETFEGANVIEPEIGLFDRPTNTLDWASLYPSIMVTHNLCPSTYVAPGFNVQADPFLMRDPDPLRNLSAEERQRREDEAIYTVESLVSHEPFEERAEPGAARFLRHTVMVGLVVSILQRLLAWRKRVKGEMDAAKNAGDHELAALLDKRQLEIKLLCNSIYGLFGAVTAFIFCQPVSASVTCRGRALLYKMRYISMVDFAQHNVRVVYGDSVTGDTPLVLRINNIVQTRRIDEVAAFERWQPYGDPREGKECYEPTGLFEVWCDGGFTPVRRLIRHECGKTIVRVRTRSGVVDCTTDHSLVRADGTECTPNEARVGDRLLHEPNDSALLDELSLGRYSLPEWTGGLFGRFVSGKSDFLSSPEVKLDFYNAHGERRVPTRVLNANIEALREFWDGFTSEAGAGDVYLQGKELATGLWLIARRLGFSVEIVELPSGDLRLVWNKEEEKREEKEEAKEEDEAERERAERERIESKRIVWEPSVEEPLCLVYDLETESHHFHVGPGNLVVHNTDSIFVHLPDCDSVDAAAELGCQMAAHITKRMRADYTKDAPEYNILKLEFEKTFRIIILFAKKRYAGLKYVKENGEVVPSPGDCLPTVSGLETQRRDVTALIKRELTHVLSIVLDYRYSTRENLVRSREYIWHTMMRPLLTGTIDMADLILTRQLRKTVEDYRGAAGGAAKSLPAHAQLALKLTDRAGGPNQPGAPKSGERLPSVTVRGEPGQKQSERTELPTYVLEHGLELDAQYYIDNHVRNSVLRIFTPICGAIERKSNAVLFNSGVAASSSSKTRAKQAVARDVAEDELAAAEFLFGHKTLYRDPYREGDTRGIDIVPATLALEREEISKRVAKGLKGVVPTVLRKPRYSTRRTIELDTGGGGGNSSATKRSAADGSAAQPAKRSALGAFGVVGARCRGCGKFHQGRAAGFVCEQCAASADKSAIVQDTNAELQRCIVDIEDLRSERHVIETTCHHCMEASHAPQLITCRNDDCPVYWQRTANQLSLREASKRVTTLRGALDAAGLSLGRLTDVDQGTLDLD